MMALTLVITPSRIAKKYLKFSTVNSSCSAVSKHFLATQGSSFQFFSGSITVLMAIPEVYNVSHFAEVKFANLYGISEKTDMTLLLKY